MACVIPLVATQIDPADRYWSAMPNKLIHQSVKRQFAPPVLAAWAELTASPRLAPGDRDGAPRRLYGARTRRG